MAHSASESERSRSQEAARKNKEQPSEDHNICLYIGNIDKRLTEDQLREAFLEHGELEYCYIVYEPHSGTGGSRGDPKQSRGYGFAKYKNPEDAQKAKQKMQGFDLNGRKINVEFSKRAAPREPTPGRYLGKKRSSPVRKSHKRSYSRSSSRSHKRHRYHHEKRRRHERSRSRSRSDSYRRRRSSYSRSPRR